MAGGSADRLGENGMNVLVTGANGFIGRALCSRLASDNKVVGVDITGPSDGALNIAWERADLTDLDSVAAVCEKYSPDVVIHCAGCEANWNCCGYVIAGGLVWGICVGEFYRADKIVCKLPR